jgi:hypothetical protein
MSDLSAHPAGHASPPSLGETRSCHGADWLVGMEEIEKNRAPLVEDESEAPEWAGLIFRDKQLVRELRSFVQLLLRLRNQVAEHGDRRNIGRCKRVSRAISPHCGSVERGSGRIFFVAAIHHKHVL